MMKLRSVDQPEAGYRYSIDAYLLAAFAARFECASWCDLGTGSGIVADLLCHTHPERLGLAIERDPELVQFARGNLAWSSCSVVEADIRSVSWSDYVVDLFVCNPPFFALDSGRLNRHSQIAAARHAIHGEWIDLLASVDRACHSQTRFCVVLPYGFSPSFRTRIESLGWHIEEQFLIRSYVGQPPFLECFSLTMSKSRRRLARWLTLYRKHHHFSADSHCLLRPFVA